MVFSRAISIALFFVYILYLVFQLKTHTHLFRMTQSSMTKDIELEDACVMGNDGMQLDSIQIIEANRSQQLKLQVDLRTPQ